MNVALVINLLMR